MRHARVSRTAALAAVLAIGCTESPSPTGPAVSSAPSFDVQRGTAAFAFPLADGRYTLVFGHSFEDMAAICARTEPSFPTWDQLTVTRPTGQGEFEESVKQLTRATDAVITVFEYGPFEFGNECPLLAAPYYEGSGRAFLEDNDVFLTHHGANSFSIRVVGTVTDRSGQRYHVVARHHQVLSPASTLDDLIFLQPPRIDIQLTPIGG